LFSLNYDKSNKREGDKLIRQEEEEEEEEGRSEKNGVK